MSSSGMGRGEGGVHPFRRCPSSTSSAGHSMQAGHSGLHRRRGATTSISVEATGEAQGSTTDQRPCPDQLSVCYRMDGMKPAEMTGGRGGERAGNMSSKVNCVSATLQLSHASLSSDFSGHTGVASLETWSVLPHSNKPAYFLRG